MSLFGRHQPFTPWIRLPSRLLAFISKRFPTITDSEKLVVIAIMMIHPDRYPSAQKLAEAVGVHRRTVGRSLTRLRELGIVGGNGRRRLGLGEIQEVSLDPLWDMMAEVPADSIGIAELIEEQPKMLPVAPPAPSPLTDEDYAKQFGPPGATAAEAAVMRKVQADYNQGVAAWHDDIVSGEAEQKALAKIEDKAQLALGRFMPVQIDMNLVGEEAPPPRDDDNEDDDRPRQVLYHKDLPAPVEKPVLLSAAALSHESFKKFQEETVAHAVKLYYPLWADGDLFTQLGTFIGNRYQQPACSHQEVWDRIQDDLVRYVKDRAASEGHDWRRENERFGKAWAKYVEQCEYLGEKSVRLQDFREDFYRYAKYQEFVR